MAESVGRTPSAAPTQGGPSADPEGLPIRCFKTGGQIYYGAVLEAEDGSGFVRQNHGVQIVTATTVGGETITWSKYDGTWDKDQMTGKGTLTWSDGSVYEGELLNGQPHGKGKLLWPERSWYDGCWSHGEFHGQGSFHSEFDDTALHGSFCRNSFKRPDGAWVDARKLREEQRMGRLKIGAAPLAEAELTVIRCTPDEVGARVLATQREGQRLVPFVLADTSCQEAAPPGAAPLCFLERGEHGCAPATTVFLAHAANEKRRKRDHLQLFRSAVSEALQTARTFVLAFGPEGAGPVPASWSLDEFFDRGALPRDIFDLQAFNASEEVQHFLPPEKRGMRSEVLGDAPPPPPAEGGEEEEGSRPAPAILAPPVVYQLSVAVASTQPVDASLAADDAWVRGHVTERFAAAVPLQRTTVIVVSDAACG